MGSTEMELGRLQGAQKAVEDRLQRHEERFDAFLAQNAASNAATNTQIGLIIKKLDTAEGRSLQRMEDTARLTRRVGWLMTIAGIGVALMGILVEGHIHLFGGLP